MSNTASEMTAIIERPLPVTASPTLSEQESAFQPALYLRRHPKLAIAVALATLLLGTAALKLSGMLTPIYSASSVVYVSPVFPHELNTDDREYDRSYDAFIEQQTVEATRYDALKETIQKNQSFWMLPQENIDNAVVRLQKQLKVAQVGHSYQLTITLQSKNPKGLPEFVNDITRGYLESARNNELYGIQDRITTLTAAQKTISAQLAQDLNEQSGLMSNLGMVSFNPKTDANPYDEKLNKLREQLSEAQEKLAEANAQVHAFNDARTKGGTAAINDVAATQVNLDPSITSMKTQLTTRREQLVLQMNGLTTENPLYQQSQKELNFIDQKLDELQKSSSDTLANHLRQKMLADRQQAQELEAQLNSTMSHTQAAAVSATPKLQRAETLSDEITRLQGEYDAIDTRIKNLMLDNASPGSEHIVTWALPPGAPSLKKTAILGVGLVFFSLFAGFAAAAFATISETNIYSSSDIRTIVGFPPIGLLLDEADFPTAFGKDQMLRLMGGIDKAHRSGARTFLFSSAGKGRPRDIVIGLGEELALNGLSSLVILVRTTNAKDDAAVSTVESWEKKSSAAAHVSLTAGSSLLAQRKEFGVGPAAGRSAAADELRVIAASPHEITEILRRNRDAFDIIMVAAEPILASAYTEHLARHTDATVLVVESGKVTKKQLVRAARVLERIKIAGVAVVLSEIREKRAEDEILQSVREYAQV
jgi:uncharacterized protein involved in exopolysaccharide biosynthesis